MPRTKRMSPYDRPGHIKKDRYNPIKYSWKKPDTTSVVNPEIVSRSYQTSVPSVPASTTMTSPIAFLSQTDFQSGNLLNGKKLSPGYTYQGGKELNRIESTEIEIHNKKQWDAMMEKLAVRFSEALHIEQKGLLTNFLLWLMPKYENIRIVRLYLGDQMVKPPSAEEKIKIIVIVIDDYAVIKEKVFELNGKKYLILCKLWKSSTVEEERVTKFEIDSKIEEAMLVKFEQCLKSRSKTLFRRHSNLEIISMSAVRSKNNGKEVIHEPSIVLYCSCKGVLPLNEDEFPTSLNNIPTDVREGFFYHYATVTSHNSFMHQSNFEYQTKHQSKHQSKHQLTDFLDPLRMGAVISRKDRITQGTLGGFVTMESGDIGFITCAHVLHNVSENFNLHENAEVLQPHGKLGAPDDCGVLQKSVTPRMRATGCPTVDAALVKITSRKPTRGLFAGMNKQQLLAAGLSVHKQPKYDDGAIRDFRQQPTRRDRRDLCIKFGASTGLTSGHLQLKGVAVKWKEKSINLGQQSSYNDVTYFSQLQIIGFENNLFAKHGDSGALVFQFENDDRLVCIGMVVGGITQTNKTIVTPIGPILKALNVKMHTFISNAMDVS